MADTPLVLTVQRGRHSLTSELAVDTLVTVYPYKAVRD